MKIFDYAVIFGTVAALQVAASPGQAKTIRLIDVLKKSHVVQSPLLDLQATTFKDAPAAEIPHRVLFHEGFEDFQPSRLNWPKAKVSRTPKRGGTKGFAWHYSGEGGHRYVIVLPAKPQTRYRIHRSIKTSQTRVDLTVLEHRQTLRHPNKINHPTDLKRLLRGRFVSVKDLLYVHRFAKPRQAHQWQRDSLTLYSTPRTHALILILDDAESAIAAKNLDVWLDDLRVDELEPEPQHELAMLSAEDAASDKGIGIGLVKHGQLLPTSDASTVTAPFDHNFDYRYALFAPAPTTLSFPVSVPRDARLSFSIALSKAAKSGDRAKFEVAVRASGQQRTVFERELRLNNDWRWHDVQVPLDEYGDQAVEVVLKTTSHGTKGYALWGGPIIDSPRSSNDAPNVVVIAIDTLRADRLSSYGYARKTSPHLDAIAADGIRFDQAISASNWTSSAFASIFTGVTPSRHRVVHRARALPDRFSTLPEYFQQNGWTTQGVAYKAYLYNMGFEQGFDAWFNVPKADNIADDNFTKATAWLERNHDRRFFFFLHFNDPHQPFNQPAEFVDGFVDQHELKRFGARLPMIIGKSKVVQGCTNCGQGSKVSDAFKPTANALYDGEIAYVDDRIGKLVALLKAKGLYEDTVIAVVSDHGEILWDRGGIFGHGGKYLTDELVRVPLIIKPARKQTLATGISIKAQVRTLDLLPTLTDLAGIAANHTNLDGKSLVPLMQAPEKARDRVAISENVKHDVLSVRFEGWKYVLHHPPHKAAREQLFDLGNDPQERIDRARKQPRRLDTMRQLAVRHLVNSRSGRWVVVLGQKRAKPYRISVRSSNAQRAAPLLGLGLRSSKRGDKEAVFAGKSTGRLLLLAHLDGADNADIEVKVADKVVTRAQKLDPAGLAEAFEQTNLQVFLYKGAPATERPKERTELSADQMAILKALGYMD